MEVSQVVETPDGAVTFQAKLNSDEVAYYLMVAINLLVKQGMVPLHAVRQENIASVLDGSEELQ